LNFNLKNAVAGDGEPKDVDAERVEALEGFIYR